MNNTDVTAALREIAELLELKNESSFRIRAYENAAKAVSNLTEDVRALVASDDLTHVKGIGKGIAQRIEELITDGHIVYLDELRAQFPSGVRELMRVPGVGPSLARRVLTELGVQNLDELHAAAEDGRLAGMSGFGEKSAQNVLRALGRVSKDQSRISIGTALPVVEELLHTLRGFDVFERIQPAGSLRRWAPTIGDIDLMATAPDPARAMEAFVSLPQVRQVLGHGPTKSTIITDNGLQVDLRIVEAESFGSLVQHFTGSRDHNIELREYALARGLSLNEYGITATASREVRKFTDEVEFYAALGLAYIAPELREGTGEIRAAERGSLPDLVSVDDIRGDLHMHSTWSDGACSIEEMVIAAKARGYEYVALTDHSGGIGVAHGLTAERLAEQQLELAQVRAAHPDIQILAGTELEIRRDGTLDFPDEVLATLDWVIASIHSGFNQSEDEMTARMLRAIENPHVDAIAHPTGRLIGKREPYAIDLEAIFRAAARTRTVLEINSFPERLDLVDRHARRALELGCTLVIDTDAHAPVNFENLRYGVAMARRGWAQAENVLNTRGYAELRAWLRRDAP
jgi:DNA polymerase (family 10)